MKILTTTVMVITILTLSGCASRYTSIEETNIKNNYIITEAHARPFGVSSEVHDCVAKTKTVLECRQIN